MRPRACSLRRQLVEQPPRFLEIGSVKAFRKPAVDGRKEVAGFVAAPLVTAQAGKAYGGAQFPELCMLALRDFQRFSEQRLCVRRVSIPEQLAAMADQLRLEPVLAARSRYPQSLVKDTQCNIGVTAQRLGLSLERHKERYPTFLSSRPPSRETLAHRGQTLLKLSFSNLCQTAKE